MAQLTQKPLRRYHPPAYPTRLEAAADPDLLRRHIPESWLSGKEVAGLLSVLLAVNGGGCSKNSPPGPSTRPAGSDLAGKAAIVAPIFEHGDGRGSTGCVVVNPPVFLSEEEALQVITEELSQAGLNSLNRDVALEGVAIPPRQVQYKQDFINSGFKSETVPLPDKARPFHADLEDPKHQIAVEFIAQTDYADLGGVRSMSTAQSYNFKDVAKWAGKHVTEQGHGFRLALFYDPLARPDWDFRRRTDPQSARAERENVMEASKTESKRLLRLQVKDFVDWLKGQGVI